MRKEKSYDKDYYAWAMTQATLLKKGLLDDLDIKNLVEEIISLGNSERDKLESHLTILLMHMLKIKYQPAKKSRSWDLSVRGARRQANRVLHNNPSLRPKLNTLIADAYYSARLEAAIETGLDEKKFPKECPWTKEEILSEESDAKK